MMVLLDIEVSIIVDLVVVVAKMYTIWYWCR